MRDYPSDGCSPQLQAPAPRPRLMEPFRSSLHLTFGDEYEALVERHMARIDEGQRKEE